ncbi:MAG: YunC family protein [Verrucomicrobia bacterium]|nr:YunC family protein [Verrucomicrobiota bacterium]
MEHTEVQLSTRKADGYVIPAGPFNLVAVLTDAGMIGCGAFDVKALDAFSYPAVRISGVATIDDLLNGIVKEANTNAQARGIKEGMTGREAAELL